LNTKPRLRTEVIRLRVSPDDRRRLDRIAAARGTKPSGALRALVDEEVERLELAGAAGWPRQRPSAGGAMKPTGATPARRELRVHATARLEAAAPLVTDLTAPLLVGLEGWQFRQLLRDKSIPHARVGKRVIAELADVVTAVRELGKRQRAEVS
jgi:hypothetical protein